VADLVLDPARSRVRIHTFAEGLLARLAHDLELVCGALSGTASGDAGAGKASIDAPLSGMAVTGILGKDGRVDEHGLSASERRDVVSKMQKEVFHAGPGAAVRVEGQLDGGKARVRVIPPAGRPFEAVVPVTVRADGGDVHATGSLEVSLSAIGSDPVKGPMGAFRVKDKVKVTFDLMFSPRG
jgi:hypothetical protein